MRIIMRFESIHQTYTAKMASVLSLCVLVLLSFVLGLSNACSQGSDCDTNECCVQTECKPFGNTSDHCYVHMDVATGGPTEMVTKFNLCPCLPGRTCARINIVHIEYGQVGMCLERTK